MDQLADAAFPGGTPPDPPKPNHSPLASRGAGPTLTHLPEVSAPTSSPKKSHTGYLKAEASKPSDSKPLSVDDKNRKYFLLTPNSFEYHLLFAFFYYVELFSGS